MAKHSKFENDRRAAETVRMKEIEAAWYASTPAEVARAFERDVAIARARGPLEPPPNQPPGTRPNPPAPGREPKPEKVDRNARGGRS